MEYWANAAEVVGVAEERWIARRGSGKSLRGPVAP